MGINFFLKKIKGFYTYEAAILLPTFAFFTLVFLLLFRALSFQWGLTESVYDAADHVALLGDGDIDVGRQTGETDHSGNSAINQATVYLACNAKVRTNKVSQKFLRHPLGIVNYAATEVNDKDLDVKVSTMMPLLAGQKFFGKRGYELGNRICVRRWNGFDPATGADGDEEIVYVTDTGEVYHQSTSCTFIKLSIHTASVSALGRIRSENGSIYHPCEECGSAISVVAYYTDYGDRAHSSLTCSKLKRTIHAIPKKEAVKHYRPCSKCAGG